MIPRRDVGLQAERTVLAWHRTALAIVVNALLALRGGMVSGRTWVEALGILLLLAGAAASLVGASRRRHFTRTGDPVAASPPALLLVVAVTWLACLAGLATVTLHLH